MKDAGNGKKSIIFARNSSFGLSTLLNSPYGGFLNEANSFAVIN